MSLRLQTRLVPFLLLVSALLYGRFLEAQNKFAAQSSAHSSRKTCIGTRLEILSDKQGVDFAPYLNSAFKSINQHWFALMPVSVQLGTAGQNSVTFRVMGDGSVPKEFLKLESSSGKDLLDDASLRAIQKASPFKHLPDNFSAPFIELRAKFLYNVPSDSK